MNARSDYRHSMLERLLGPTGPEVSCEQCFELLDEYVDLELSSGDAEARVPDLRNHLDGCPACREDYESLREFVAARHPSPDH